MLEPLFAYLLIAKKQYEDKTLEGAYNVGPDENDYLTTGGLVEAFCASYGSGCVWKNENDGGPHEAGFLKLDLSKIKTALGWHPLWNICAAVQKTVEWQKAAIVESPIEVTRRQIFEYIQDGARQNGE